MALSEDQKAILRLLAQRGEQGYEDLTALMGIGVGEVHAKALEAASQLESEGIPAPEIPPPPGPSAAESRPPAKPEPAEPPTPERRKAEPGPPATPKARKAPPAGRPEPPAAQRPRPALPQGGAARAAIAAGALVVVALIVILIVGGGDSDDSTGRSDDGGAAVEEALNANAGEGREVTQAILEPVDGGDAAGVATFGRVKNSLALQIEATGLEPTGKGESYTIWLYESPQKMLPLASTIVGGAGKIGAQVEVPTEVLGYLANETFDQIDVSLTEDAALKASLEKATSEKEAPIYTGTDVLRGQITGPIIGAAKKGDE